MELGDRRHSGDALAAQLSELLSFGGVDVDEAVHVPDAETVDRVGWVALPLGSEARCGISNGKA